MITPIPNVIRRLLKEPIYKLAFGLAAIGVIGIFIDSKPLLAVGITGCIAGIIYAIARFFLGTTP